MSDSDMMTEVFKVEDVMDLLNAYAIAKSSEKEIQELTFQLKNILTNCCPSYLSRSLLRVAKEVQLDA